MTPTQSPRWQIGATLVRPGRGGIAAVARITLRALVEAGADAALLSYLDDRPGMAAGRTMRVARGSRARFAAGLLAAAARSDLFLYDSVGMARAHPRLPGLRRPYAVWVHGVEVWNGLTPGRARALRGADLLLANSRFTLARLEARHGPLRAARVCELGTEADRPPAPRPPRPPDAPPVVLCLGRIDRAQMYKGQRELVACWAEVVQAVPGARLVIAGGGDGVPLIREAARRSPAAGFIEVTGHVREGDLEALWARADLFAMPSRGEGFGLVYAEAMRRGLPVIASCQDAGQEVNRHGETGLNADLDAPGALSAALIALLRDPGLRARLGAQGARHWQARFRYGAFRDRLLPILDEFAATTRPTPRGARA
ncbi:glycosyltransferase family 4 protein [Rhodosalinus sp. FB01]|uniref:glycosyltransferase family 4 protein n=1 Tax=Rhodosalinus sp. FB01 TaxID=3239194 RepID=UPI003523F91D